MAFATDLKLSLRPYHIEGALNSVSFFSFNLFLGGMIMQQRPPNLLEQRLQQQQQQQQQGPMMIQRGPMQMQGHQVMQVYHF